jgi:hypothetical protein
MKRIALVCLFVITAFAFAQNNSQKNAATVPGEAFKYVPPGMPSELNPQAGCPVIFTDVALKTNAHFMRVRQGAPPDRSVDFQYKNQSGKLIAAISVRADLKVKKSVYDLDTTTVTLNMALSGTGAEEILPLTMLAYGLDRVTLEQVSYIDGTIWTADTKRACSYQSPSSSLMIGKLQ